MTYYRPAAGESLAAPGLPPIADQQRVAKQPIRQAIPRRRDRAWRRCLSKALSMVPRTGTHGTRAVSWT